MSDETQEEFNPHRAFKVRLQRIRRLIYLVVGLAVAGLVVLLARVPIDERIMAAGHVRAEADTRLYAPVDGVVTEIFAREGDRVEAGAPVLGLDATEAAARRERAKEARLVAAAELALAEARLDRLRRLALPEEFRHLENERAAARERTAQAQVEYERAKELTALRIITGQELERARLSLELRRLEQARVEEKWRSVSVA